MGASDGTDAAGERGANAAVRPFAIACLSTQPWDVDLPTNRQQIMARAARAGHDVLFVDTGTFVGRHVRDVLRGPARRRALQALVATRPVAPRVRECKAPALLPWGHRLGFAARVNARLTALAVRRRLRDRPEPSVLWLYDPCFAGAIGRSGEAIAVYDCVDDYPEQSGGDERRRRLVTECDREAARRSAVVFATATPLYERHSATNPNTQLVRNVGDYAHFVPAADRAHADERLAELPRPVVGFAGNFLSNKVDLDLLEELAELRPDWTLLLVGPARADTEERVRALAGRPNVTWTGPVPYELLPRSVAVFDVGLIPYLDNAYTRSCFPLKVFEYLAAGKPVVATGLPELAGMEPEVVLARGADEAMAAIEAALADAGEGPREARQRLAAANTWETRAERLLQLTREAL